LTELRAWLYVQLRSKKVVVALELPQRLGAVVLRQVHSDQSGTRALSQTIHPHRGERGLSGIAIPAGGGEQSSKRLQGVQAKLPPVLGLEEDPVLIPVRQQFLREDSDRRSTEIRGTEGLIRSLQEAVGSSCASRRSTRTLLERRRSLGFTSTASRTVPSSRERAERRLA
jgi:hypothetical protein